MKAMSVTAVPCTSTRKASVAVAGRGLRGHSALASTEAQYDPTRVADRMRTGLSPIGAKGARDATKAISMSGTVLYDACGAGKKFRSLSCAAQSSEIDLSDRQTRVFVLENYIECGDSESRKRKMYHIEVTSTSGVRSFTGQPGYFARARIMHDRKTLPDQHYCWLRLDAGGDGHGCLCAVALKGSVLGRRPECSCESV
jgi:hypothetical protein